MVFINSKICYTVGMKNKNKKKISLLLLVAVFASSNLFGFTVQADDIGDIKNKIETLEEKKAREEKDLQAAQANLAKNQVQVGTTLKVLNVVTTDLSKKEQELENLNARIEASRKMLQGYLREAYFLDQKDPLLEMTVEDVDLNDVVDGFDQMVSIKKKILDTLNEIQDNQLEVEKKKLELAEKKDDHEEILADQKAEQQGIKSDIYATQATLAELNAKLDKMRGDLTRLLGANVTAKDIEDAAAIASKATGVRKDFILGELVIETDLGRFTGGCTYKNTRMREADKTAFKGIMKDLGYDVNKKKISCSPGYGYGGAMGVAQFMPTTWLGYKARIASATGHNPPDPWSITDGVVGMAIKLAAGGATSKSGEKLASKRYYCGGPSSPYWKNKCDDYASKVQYWADNYEKKL
jgi:peptidoglycan hydrolase CwlO-like protein